MLMKFKNLLFLGAALLASNTVSAELVNGVRQKPVPATSELQYDAAMYMYNTGAGKYYLGANDWSTQASVGDNGWKVKISKHIDAATGEWDEQTVILTDSVENGSYKGKWLMGWFVGGGNTMYTDHNGQADTLWLIKKVGDVYRLSASAENVSVNTFSENFIGVNDTLDGGTNTRLFSDLNDCAEHLIDWKFVAVADYTTHQSAIEIYNVAEKLNAVIAEAKEKGIAVSAYETVYANEAATLEEVEAALKSVKQAIAQYEMNSVDPNNPIDKTSLLANPGYDDGKTDWTDTNSDWAVSYNVAEHYDDVFDHYQKLTDVASGVYALTVRGYCRPASSTTAWNYWLNNTPTNAYIYGATGEDTVTAALPNIWAGASEAALSVGTYSTATDADDKTWYCTNNMQGAEAYFADEELGPKYDVTVFFGVPADSMRVGIALETLVGDDWVLWDNWRLAYYGGKAEAYALWVENMKANAVQYDEETVATEGVVDAYNATVAALTATDYASAVAAKASLDEAAAVVAANVAAWADYQATLTRAGSTVMNPNLDPSCGALSDLADYVDFDSEDILSELSMSTEEVIAETEMLSNMIHEASTGCLPIDAEVTDLFLTNYNFEDTTDGKADGKGWEGSWTAFGGPSNNKCMEGYGITFDAHQTVSGAPVGVYEVSLQGFFRTNRGTTAYELYQNGGQVSPAVVYVNNNTSAMKCVFDEPVLKSESIYSGTQVEPESDAGAFEDYITGDSVLFPNTMTTAGEAFAKGMYTSSAVGIVAELGDELVLGVRGTLGSTTWAIWDDFRMFYRGTKADAVKPHLEVAIAAANENLTKGMAKDVREAVTAAIATGNEALNGTDGGVMFAALKELYSLNDSVTASVALFEELSNDAVALYDLLGEYPDASTEVKNQVSTLYEEVLGAVEECSITNDEARAYQETIKKLAVLVKLPGDLDEATDDNLKELTSILATPTFDNEGANSIEGWSGTDGYNFGNDDTQKAALLVEFYNKTFDLYQDVNYLPAGTYTVQVSAFYRYGSSAEDYANWLTDPNAGLAYLYASSNNGANYREETVELLASGATEDLGYSGTTTVTAQDESTLYVPNDMVSADNYFTELGKYTNKVVITIGEGETLRIGMKKESSVSSDWVILDSWKLYYHGTNSSADAIEEVATAAEVVKVEIYTLNGVQVNKLQKGLNIVKKTLANGVVVVEKKLCK